MKVKKFGIIHAYAQCSDCEWTATMDLNSSNRMAKLRAQIKRHVVKEKHRVVLETGNATEYKCE